MPALARADKCSVEEAGRKARQEVFASCAGDDPHAKIALAHQAEDLAETVLYQLSRGSGLTGFAGIRPVNGRVIRPLLHIPRKEIEAYLSERGQAYREDPTNAEDEYARNRIRHHVIPYLENEIHEGAARHIAAAASDAQEVLAYIEDMAGRRAAGAIREVPEGILIGQEALREEGILQFYIFRNALRRLDASFRDFGRIHYGILSEFSGKPAGKTLDLPGGIKADRTREGILLRKSK